MKEKGALRRSFLKKAVIGSVSVVATAGIAKKVVDVAIDKSGNGSDSTYLGKGEVELSGRKYVEMSQAEKQKQVRMFVDNYRYEDA